MFGIGWAEMLMILLVAAFVIGPKDLPRALHSAGKLMRKFRAFTGDIQQSLDRIMREEDLNEIIREANKPGEGRIDDIARQQYEEELRRLQTAVEHDDDVQAHQGRENRVNE